jgi:hypothetical protein
MTGSCREHTVRHCSCGQSQPLSCWHCLCLLLQVVPPPAPEPPGFEPAPVVPPPQVEQPTLPPVDVPAPAPVVEEPQQIAAGPMPSGTASTVIAGQAQGNGTSVVAAAAAPAAVRTATPVLIGTFQQSQVCHSTHWHHTVHSSAGHAGRVSAACAFIWQGSELHALPGLSSCFTSRGMLQLQMTTSRLSPLCVPLPLCRSPVSSRRRTHRARSLARPTPLSLSHQASGPALCQAASQSPWQAAHRS